MAQNSRIGAASFCVDYGQKDRINYNWLTAAHVSPTKVYTGGFMETMDATDCYFASLHRIDLETGMVDLILESQTKGSEDRGFVYSICEDPRNGDIYFTASDVDETNYDTPGIPERYSLGYSQVHLFKYDKDGNKIWSRRVVASMTTFYNNCMPALVWHPDNFLVLVVPIYTDSYYSYYGCGGGGACVFAINPSTAEEIWVKTCSPASMVHVLSTIEERAIGLCVHPSGDISVALNGDDRGLLQWCLFRFTKSGEPVHKRMYITEMTDSGPSYSSCGRLNAAKLCADGEDAILVVGLEPTSYDAIKVPAIIVSRVNTQGNLVLTKCYKNTDYKYVKEIMCPFIDGQNLVIGSVFEKQHPSNSYYSVGYPVALVLDKSNFSVNELAVLPKTSAYYGVSVYGAVDHGGHACCFATEGQFDSYRSVVHIFCAVSDMGVSQLDGVKYDPAFFTLTDLEVEVPGYTGEIQDPWFYITEGYTYWSGEQAATDTMRVMDMTETYPPDNLRFIFQWSSYGQVGRYVVDSVSFGRLEGNYGDQLWDMYTGTNELYDYNNPRLGDYMFRPDGGSMTNNTEHSGFDIGIESMSDTTKIDFGGSIQSGLEFTIDGMVRFTEWKAGKNPIVQNGRVLRFAETGWSYHLTDGYLEFVAGVAGNYTLKRSDSKVPLNSLIYLSADYYDDDLHFSINGAEFPSSYVVGSSFVGKSTASSVSPSPDFYNYNTYVFYDEDENYDSINGSYECYWFRMFTGYCRNKTQPISIPGIKMPFYVMFLKDNQIMNDFVKVGNPIVVGLAFLLWAVSKFWDIKRGAAEYEVDA